MIDDREGLRQWVSSTDLLDLANARVDIAASTLATRDREARSDLLTAAANRRICFAVWERLRTTRSGTGKDCSSSLQKRGWWPPSWPAASAACTRSDSKKGTSPAASKPARPRRTKNSVLATTEFPPGDSRKSASSINATW